jgi:hypothetical protein
MLIKGVRDNIQVVVCKGELTHMNTVSTQKVLAYKSGPINSISAICIKVLSPLFLVMLTR